jgi:hypothetical protein
MYSCFSAIRPTTFIGATAAVAATVVLLMPAAAPADAAAPAAASAGGATTIYTCVSKRNGTMRIVSAKAKCRHGEHKLSWNASGPAGPAGVPGAPGAAGAPGANGVGADYSSFDLGPVNLALSEKGDVVVTKTIPAGTYFVNAKTVIGATEATKAVFVVAICELVDTAGTVGLVELPGALDVSEWLQQLSNSFGSEYEGGATLAMQAQLTTTEPTTLAMVCVPAEGSKEAKIVAVAAQLSALQTTANK